MNNKSSKIIVRSGYPLSSSEFNEIFEHLIYDAAKIMSTPMPNLLNTTMSTYFDYVDDYSDLLNQSQLGVQINQDSVEKDHTSNWRQV